MELCLVRHAIAVERGSPGYADDASRPLTDEGRERMKGVARGLARFWTPQLIVSSPLVRARQTGEIVRNAWGQPPLRYAESLANGDHSGLFADLREHGQHKVAVVGHEPWLSSLLSYALTGDANIVSSRFKKGGAALVEFPGDVPDTGTARLLWFLPPAATRMMDKGER